MIKSEQKYEILEFIQNIIIEEQVMSYSNGSSHSSDLSSHGEPRDELYWKKSIKPDIHNDPAYVFGDRLSDQSGGQMLNSRSYSQQPSGQHEDVQKDKQRKKSLQQKPEKPHLNKSDIKEDSQMIENEQDFNNIGYSSQINHRLSQIFPQHQVVQDRLPSQKPEYERVLENHQIKQVQRGSMMPIEQSPSLPHQHEEKNKKQQNSRNKGIFGGKCVMIGGAQDNQDLNKGIILDNNNEEQDPQVHEEFSLPNQLIDRHDENKLLIFAEQEPEKLLKPDQINQNISAQQMQKLSEQIVEGVDSKIKQQFQKIPKAKQFQHFRVHFQAMAKEQIQNNIKQNQQNTKNQLKSIKDISIKNSQMNEIVNSKLQELEQNTRRRIDEIQESNNKRIDQVENKIDKIADKMDLILELLKKK